MIISVPNLIVDLQQNSILTQNKLFLISKRIFIVYALSAHRNIISMLFLKNFKFLPIIIKTKFFFSFRIIPKQTIA